MNASRIVLVAFHLGVATFTANTAQTSDTPPAWPLHAAVKAKDAVALQRALAATPDVNARDGKVFPCKYMESISTVLNRTRRQIAHAAANDRCDVTQEDAKACSRAQFDESLEAGLANCLK